MFPLYPHNMVPIFWGTHHFCSPQILQFWAEEPCLVNICDDPLLSGEISLGLQTSTWDETGNGRKSNKRFFQWGISISMGWLKGKSTGNHRISHEIWVFPAIFPLNQSVEYSHLEQKWWTLYHWWLVFLFSWRKWCLNRLDLSYIPFMIGYLIR